MGHAPWRAHHDGAAMKYKQLPVTITLFAVMAIMGWAAGALAQTDSLDNLTQELIELRGEAQRLNSELELNREQHKNRMQSLERQRGEIEARVKREQRKITKLEKTIAENREAAAKAGVAASDLEPVLFEAIEMLREGIATGLPFKVGERVGALDEIAQKLNSDVLPPHKAANQLWAFYEDELRLTRENGIFQQTIALQDSRKYLANVAKLGMVMLYFETDDKRYGAAVKQGSGWVFEEYFERDKKERVASLFDQLRKQIRTGFFTLPNTLSDAELR